MTDMGDSLQTPGNPFSLLDSNRFPEERPLRPILTLGDRYLVTAVRRGGMGEVYICQLASEPEQTRALKTFHKELFFDRSSQIAFVQEVAIWMRLSGIPHVIPAMALEYINGRPFVSMPAVTLDTSNKVSVRDFLGEEPILVETAFEWIVQTAIGMSLAQRQVPGLVHADLKPENLLVFNGRIFISDFGLARVLDQSEGQVGLDSTWAYKAPECWASSSAASSASDIYAFGIIIYELLYGRRPFDETTEAGWARAHRYERPSLVAASDSDPLAERLGRLALKCLEKGPEDRPHSFGDIRQDLFVIGEETDAVMHLMTLYESVQLKTMYESLQKDLRSQLVRTLLRLDFIDQALEELDTWSPDVFEDELWFLKGNALSLRDQDEEAISCFEKVLEYDVPAEKRLEYLSDLALTLKRLERFDDAIQIYEHLLTEVPETLVPRIVTNLATVYREQEKPEEAIRLLAPLTREHPKLAEAWGNLGLAYKEASRYNEAWRCLQRAVRVAPERADLRVPLAALYMDHLGMVYEALDSLYLAYQQGYESAELYVRLLACFRFFEDAEQAREFEQALKEVLEPSVWDDLIREAEDMANRIARDRHT